MKNVLIAAIVLSALLNGALFVLLIRSKRNTPNPTVKEEFFTSRIIALENEIAGLRVDNECVTDQLKSLSTLITQVSKDDLVGKDTFFNEILRGLLTLFPEADFGYIAKIDRNDWSFVACRGYDFERLKPFRYRREFFGLFPVPTELDNASDALIERVPPYMKEIFSEAFPQVSRSLTMDLEVGGQVIGNFCINIRKGNAVSFSERTLRGFRDYCQILASLMTVQKYIVMQGRFQKDIVYSMVKILEIYDSYTKGHSEHVAMLAEQIGKTLGLPVSDLQTLYWAGLVHDIGKILVPTSILNKPGKLTLDEYEMVKKHPVWGYQVLNTSEELQEIAFIIKHHHERWDGNGYPDRLSGVDIPLLSRILALVDTYDSMTSDRAYRTSLSPEDAKHIIARLSGNQFDPSLVETFLSLPSQ